jgi:hypothetical protein
MKQARKFVACRKGWAAAFGICGLAVFLGVATAGANRIEAGNLIVDFGFGSAPKQLPHTHDVPINFWGHFNMRMKDGTAPPPASNVTVEFDKFGHIETRGLPKCSKGKLVATTPMQARKLCPGAIIGNGFGAAVITFPDQAPISAGSPVTLFNGPQFKGDPSLIFHAHLTVPTPTTYLIPMRIERIRKGIYGYRVEAKIPPIAGGYGSPTAFRFRIGRDWRFKGKDLSYISARCPRSRVLRARIEARFKDEMVLHGSFLDPCKIRESAGFMPRVPGQ